MENNETALSFDEKVEKMKTMAEIYIKNNGTVGSIKLLKKSINQLVKCKEQALGPYRLISVHELEQKDAEEIKKSMIEWIKDIENQISWKSALIKAIEKLS